MKQRLSLLGGRSSGKSTWLGCTWIALRNQRGRLRSTALPEKLAPLQILSRELLHNKYPLRTNTAAAGVIEAPLLWDDHPFELEVADFDGEEIGQIFTKRHVAWTEAWSMRSEPSLGLLLFLRPTQAHQVHADRLAATRRRRDPDSPEEMFRGQTPESAATDALAVKAPFEVQLVEVMQFLRAKRGLGPGARPPERLGLVLSCWDELSESARAAGPDALFASSFPLLYDFVYTNHDAGRVQVFGLSATGGDLRTEAYVNHLNETDADAAAFSEIFWQEGRRGTVKRSSEIGLPVGWMVQGNAALL